MERSNRAFGDLLHSRREASVDPTTDQPYTQKRIAEIISQKMKELGRRPISQQLVSAWEAGNLKRPPRPEQLNVLPLILPVSHLEIVQALGYAVEIPALTPDEQELLAYYRRVPPDRKDWLRVVAKATALQKQVHT